MFHLNSSCSIVIEINPDCANIICHSGGSCVFIDESNTAVCACTRDFSGEFCKGVCIKEVTKSVQVHNINHK